MGEIVFRSPSLTLGYCEKDSDGEKWYGFGKVESKDYFPTGDLGFFKDEELFIVGRIKDQIIINGKNIDNLDLEMSVVALNNPHIGRVAAIGFEPNPGEGEKVAVVAEVRTSSLSIHQKIRKEIYKALRSSHLIDPIVFLVLPGVLPRTTSGKVKRYQVKTSVINGDL